MAKLDYGQMPLMSILSITIGHTRSTKIFHMYRNVKFSVTINESRQKMYVTALSLVAFGVNET